MERVPQPLAHKPWPPGHAAAREPSLFRDIESMGLIAQPQGVMESGPWHHRQRTSPGLPAVGQLVTHHSPTVSTGLMAQPRVAMERVPWPLAHKPWPPGHAAARDSSLYGGIDGAHCAAPWSVEPGPWHVWCTGPGLPAMQRLVKRSWHACGPRGVDTHVKGTIRTHSSPLTMCRDTWDMAPGAPSRGPCGRWALETHPPPKEIYGPNQNWHQ